MAARNGYFQLKVEQDGTYLTLFPPTQGGESIDIREVGRYLDRCKLLKYQIADINNELQNLSTEKTFKISDEVILPPDAMAVILLTKDKMGAVIRIYPPSNKGKAYTPKTIMDDLYHEGIKHGIKENVVKALAERPLYCHNIPIAKGTPPVFGKDASIEYKFNTKPGAKPKINDDGTVDYHQLDVFTKVKKGQVLAVLTPEVHGKQGMNVLGESVVPPRVKHCILKHGRSITLTEDRLQLISEVDGDVKLEGDTVFVSDTYTVAADVDPSTGDIEYEGNVVVVGNVRTGFMIKAKGDIEVRGVVEGATLISEGDIILHRGIQGMNKGVLQAEGDVVTKFIESATVKTGGDVKAGAILHSNIDAMGSIICEGKKAFTIGGTLSSRSLISLKTIGNKMGTVTNIRVGVDPVIMNEVVDLNKENEKLSEEITQSNQVLEIFKKRMENGIKLTQDKIVLIKKANETRIQNQQKLDQNLERIARCKELIAQNVNGRIKVSDIVFPGVRITIGSKVMNVREELKFCQFRLDRGEIITESYC